MNCSKCGTKNLKDAVYCINCGEKITTEKTTKKSAKVETNEAGIRKAIKADAKSKVKGYLIGITALYFAAVIIVSGLLHGIFDLGNLSVNNELLDNIQSFATLFFAAILYYCFANTAIGFIKGEESSFSTSLNKTFSNFTNVLVIFSTYAIIFAVGYVIGFSSIYHPLFGGLLSLAFSVLIIYYVPAFEMALCMLSDDKYNELSFGEIVTKAVEMVKGHRVEYYGLVISFVPWILLGILTLGILYIWLIPYTKIATTNLYARLDGQANFDAKEKGLSNGGVIGLGIGIYAAFIALITLIVITVVALYYFVTNTDKENVDNFFGEIKEEIQNDAHGDIPFDIDTSDVEISNHA